jgi:hypothetical protein
MAATITDNYHPKYIKNKLCAPNSREFMDKYIKWMESDPYNYRYFGAGPLPPDYFAPEIQFYRGGTLFDICTSTGQQWAVSDRLKTMMEEIEPGVHQFVPVRIRSKNGELRPDKYWFFTITTLIDAISDELGGVYKTVVTEEIYRWTIKAAVVPQLSVRKSVIEGRAMWMDKHYPIGIFFSDLLLERMRATNMEGWDETYYWKEI